MEKLLFRDTYTKHVNAVCGHNVEFMNVRPDVTYSNQHDRLNYLVNGLFNDAVIDLD